MRRRRGLARRLMRTLVIELSAKLVETTLLRGAVGLRRTGAYSLERLVHPLVPSVLLRPARFDRSGMMPSFTTIPPAG